MNTNKPVHNILLLGNGGVGKTAFIRSLKGDRFSPKYVADTDIVINSIELETAVLNVYDTPGQYQYVMKENLKNVFGNSAPSLVVIMCDDSKTSYKRAMEFWTEIAESVGGPMIYVHNKIDIVNRGYDNTYHISCKRNDIGGLVEGIVGAI